MVTPLATLLAMQGIDIVNDEAGNAAGAIAKQRTPVGARC